ncbi:MAG: fimbrial assembly protein [Terracidiphilus sp.]|jgi:type IV pilus assembly protein PilN
MRITLNLATRPFADVGPANKRLRIGMGVLAFLAILMGLGLHFFHSKAEAARARDHSLDGQIAQIAQERQGYQDLMKQPANNQVLLQAQVLNKLFEEKTFSWTLAMEDLETVLPGGVMVSTLDPKRDDKTGKITVNLHVIGPRDRAVELVSNLEHSKRFLFPRIIGENADAAGGPAEKLQPVSVSSRVNFELLAEYNPATSEERKVARKRAHAVEEAANQPAPVITKPTPSGNQARPPYNAPPHPAPPQAISPQAAPLQPNSPPGAPPAPRGLRPLTRRGRNPGDPNAQPGGPQ